MLKEQFIANVLSDMYTNHPKGEELLRMDLDEVIHNALAELANDNENENKKDQK